jgi:hypothetical protein
MVHKRGEISDTEQELLGIFYIFLKNENATQVQGRWNRYFAQLILSFDYTCAERTDTVYAKIIGRL